MPSTPAADRPALLLAYDFPPMGGGIARWMGAFARHAPPGALVVSTGALPGSDEADAALPQKVNRLDVPARRLRTLPGLLRWSHRASLLARSLDVGFIWCGNLKPAAYPARWVHERQGVPYGVIVHGTDLLQLQHQMHASRLKRRAGRALFAGASVVVANSRWTRDLARRVLTELGFTEAEHDLRVVPLGTDPAAFRPGLDTAEVRRRYGLDEGRWMLTLARLVAHKGIDHGLEAVARLREAHPDLRYAVIGRGPHEKALRAHAKRLGVADRVRFLTDVPDTDLPPLLNAATVYLQVSRAVERMVEGFGIAIVEASACGVPVVGGTVGGIPDAVRDDETGLLVDAEDPAAIAAGVDRLLRDEALRARLGAGGRAAVETFYNWQRVTDDLLAIAREKQRRR